MNNTPYIVTISNKHTTQFLTANNSWTEVREHATGFKTKASAREAGHTARARLYRPRSWKMLVVRRDPVSVTSKDFQLEDNGSIWLFRPLTVAAKEFLANTAPEDAQFFGNAMVVEHRYVEGVCDAIDLAGLTY